MNFAKFFLLVFEFLFFVFFSPLAFSLSLTLKTVNNVMRLVINKSKMEEWVHHMSSFLYV